MRGKRVVAVDICNTIADVLPLIEKILGPSPDGWKTYTHPDCYPGFFEEHLEVFEKAAPFLGSIEGVWWLAERFEIIYITSRPASARVVTERWLSAWQFPEADIVFTRDKAKAVERLDLAAAFEDAPEQVRSLSRKLPVFVHKRPYNTDMDMQSAFLFEWTDAAWRQRLLRLQRLAG